MKTPRITSFVNEKDTPFLSMLFFFFLNANSASACALIYISTKRHETVSGQVSVKPRDSTPNLYVNPSTTQVTDTQSYIMKQAQ